MPSLTDGYIVKYQQSTDKFILAEDGQGIPDVVGNVPSVRVNGAWESLQLTAPFVTLENRVDITEQQIA